MGTRFPDAVCACSETRCAAIGGWCLPKRGCASAVSTATGQPPTCAVESAVLAMALAAGFSARSGARSPSAAPCSPSLVVVRLWSPRCPASDKSPPASKAFLAFQSHSVKPYAAAVCERRFPNPRKRLRVNQGRAKDGSACKTITCHPANAARHFDAMPQCSLP